MSLFSPIDHPCPTCSHKVKFLAVDSLNAGRRPDLRAAIIDGTFQQKDCPACGTTFRLEPVMTYLDVPRRQWILVQPPSALASWPAVEQQARWTFHKAFGAGTPAAARALGAELQVRVTFGWRALAEKLLCAEHGFDDVTLELLKCLLLRRIPEPPIADDVELRLTGVAEARLELAWISTKSDEALESLIVAREVLSDIASDATAWQPMRQMLDGGPFVDMHRLLVDGAELQTAA
jgi:hypothetical protein